VLQLWRKKLAIRAREDASALIERYGHGAYEEARRRARDARQGLVVDGNLPNDHWDDVRREIARRTGRVIGVDTATRHPES
jgi:hypothetical protein